MKISPNNIRLEVKTLISFISFHPTILVYKLKYWIHFRCFHPAIFSSNNLPLFDHTRVFNWDKQVQLKSKFQFPFLFLIVHISHLSTLFTFWWKLREKTWCEINNVFQFNTNFPFQLHDDAIKVFLKMFKFMYLKLRLIHNLA